jgi:pimeloyl-ACP methyl ester carboxylesterase
MPEPLVLLPGLQSDHRSWVNQTRYFAGQRPVIVPQRHQHCDSIAAMADRVLEQLPPRFHLAAWSMGGYIAFRMLPQLAGRMLSLTLISTSARPEDPASTARRMDILKLARREGMMVANPRTMSQACLDFEAINADIRAGLRDASVELGVRSLSRPAARDHQPPGFPAPAGAGRLPDPRRGRRERHCNPARMRPRDSRRGSRIAPRDSGTMRPLCAARAPRADQPDAR